LLLSHLYTLFLPQPTSTPFPYTTLFRSVSTDTRQRGGYNLWPSEINQLIDLCGSISRSAFAVDTVPQSTPCEPDWWFEVGNTSGDRKSTRLNSSHVKISYAVFCLKKKSI